MIRTETEYSRALNRLLEDKDFIAAQRIELTSMGLNPEEVARAMQAAIVFHKQLEEEVQTYEQMRRGNLKSVENLTEIGRLLIGLRIAVGISQAELARRLSISESVVSRDERNEYHGISVEKAQRIIDKLKGNVTVTVQAEERSELALAAV